MVVSRGRASYVVASRRLAEVPLLWPRLVDVAEVPLLWTHLADASRVSGRQETQALLLSWPSSFLAAPAVRQGGKYPRRKSTCGALHPEYQGA